MKVIVINADDWTGLYIDGDLVDQGHCLGEGENFMYLLKLSEKYKFTSDDIKVHWICEEDNTNLVLFGQLPQKMSELKGDYN